MLSTKSIHQTFWDKISYFFGSTCHVVSDCILIPLSRHFLRSPLRAQRGFEDWEGEGDRVCPRDARCNVERTRPKWPSLPCRSGQAYFSMVFDNIHLFSLTFSKVELALAYGCSDSVSHETMLQYIHYNRHHNSMRINATGIFFSGQCLVWKN